MLVGYQHNGLTTKFDCGQAAIVGDHFGLAPRHRDYVLLNPTRLDFTQCGIVAIVAELVPHLSNLANG